MDFNFVTNRLATGGSIPNAAAIQVLTKVGITHIINCQMGHDDAPFLTETGIKYQRCPTADDGGKKGPDWFKPGIEFALQALSEPKNKVYCHCAGGVNRGPSMTFAILLALGLTYENTKCLIKTARPQANIAYRHDAEKAVNTLGYVNHLS